MTTTDNLFKLQETFEENLLLINKLNWFMEKRGITQVEIADAIGVTKGMVNQWCRFKSIGMSAETNRLLNIIINTPDDLTPKHYLLLMRLYEEFKSKSK